MKLFFLGTGGGRVVLTRQIRKTGGFLLEIDSNLLHFDPGPGALVWLHHLKLNPEKIQALFISHAHTEHFNDAPAMIEAITRWGEKKGKVLVAGKSVAEALAQHWKSMISCNFLEPGQKIDVFGLKVKATPTKHDEGSIGFVIEGKEGKFGYTSDTAYFEDLPNHFKGVDVLVFNLTRPSGKCLPHHLCTETAKMLLERVRPKIAIATHFGLALLRAGVQREVAALEKETGVRVVAATDLKTLDLSGSLLLW